MKILGILRETQNSPNRETDDALILKGVLAELARIGYSPTLMTPEEADGADLAGFDLVVPMCESYPRLSRLKTLERDSAAKIVNRPASVLACYRIRMMELLAPVPEAGFPPTELRAVAAPGPLAAPAFDPSEGFWVKRGDVHNTCDHDVVFAPTMERAEDIRRDFAQREISHLLLQRHVDGDLIKFYGVGPGQWFTWFYHDPSTSRKLPFDIEALAGAAGAAARALGLEIFGGDAIISPSGSAHLIDLNSWPSFARVRDEAARQIARRLAGKMTGARHQLS